MFYHGILQLLNIYVTYNDDYIYLYIMSMEIVGVTSTDKRAVKCFDLIKTNKSEST